jgi:hypothetical protein
MGVDIFVMPLARLWSGDYITPLMRAAWAQGLAYYVMRPDGPCSFPPGRPVGGNEAGALRRIYVEHAPELFRALAARSKDPAWNEGDEGEIGAWRPDSNGFALLCERAPNLSHFQKANSFLPVMFERPFRVNDRFLGSLQMLARELAAIADDVSFAGARRVLMDAVAEAEARRLPLHIDD